MLAWVSINEQGREIGSLSGLGCCWLGWLVVGKGSMGLDGGWFQNLAQGHFIWRTLDKEFGGGVGSCTMYIYAVGSVILAVSLALCHHVKWNEGRFWVFRV